MRVLVALLAGALPFIAQEYTTERSPVLVKKRLPCYSDEARRARLEGVVVLRTEIGVDGVPRSIKVIRSLGMGLDESAVAAVKEWRFKPGEKHGEPVAAPLSVEMVFRLGDPSLMSCSAGEPPNR